MPAQVPASESGTVTPAVVNQANPGPPFNRRRPLRGQFAPDPISVGLKLHDRRSLIVQLLARDCVGLDESRVTLEVEHGILRVAVRLFPFWQGHSACQLIAG